MEAEWTQRADILAGLDLLARVPPALDPATGLEHEWPNLNEAVHWVVDDTGWDMRDPHEDIGYTLRNGAEATLAKALVESVVVVSVRQRPEGTDRAWYTDPEWPRVRLLAAQLATEMRATDGPTAV